MVRQYLNKISILLLLGVMLLTACSELEGFLGTAASPAVNTPATGSNNSTAEAQWTPVAPTEVQPTLVPTSTPTPEPTSTATSTPIPTLTETATPAPTHTSTPEPPLIFAAIGDYGSAKDREEDVADLVMSWNPEFIITLGDNNYPDGEAVTIDDNIGQFYHSYISPYIGGYGEGAEVNRFFPTLGNHDVTTEDGQPFFDYFTLPGNERYYDFVWGPVHLYALNSNDSEPDGVGAGSVQAEWLKEKLVASESPWDIVYMHYPPYSSGTHGSIDWMQWPFAEWGVEAVLSGHDHHYERLQVAEMVYFINGLSGGDIYNLGEIHVGSQVRYNADYGAIRIELTDQYLRFEFVTRTGEVIDMYEERKKRSPQR